MEKNDLEQLKEIFSFEEKELAYHMFYKMDMKKKFIRAFNYLCKNMPVQKLKKDLGKLKWAEGKNYDWAIINDGTLTIIFRKYQSHFTIYFKNSKKEEVLSNRLSDYFYNKFGCFTFHTDREKLNDEDSDARVDNRFMDLNNHITELIQFLKNDGVHSLWNTVSFPRENFIEIKNVWNGGEDVSSLDLFVFALDELFEKYLELFATTEMFEKIKTIKEGDMLGVYKVTSVSTNLKDEYYHGVGMELQNTNFPGSKPNWSDVYALTRWHLKDVFYQPESVTDGKE